MSKKYNITKRTIITEYFTVYAETPKAALEAHECGLSAFDESEMERVTMELEITDRQIED